MAARTVSGGYGSTTDAVRASVMLRSESLPTQQPLPILVPWGSTFYEISKS